jgi:GNAT superfamily N-acetyltransferase
MRTEIPLTPDNVELVVDLYVSVFNAAPWEDGWSPAAAEERLRHFTLFPRFAGLAVLENGQAIGMALGWGERWTTGWHFHLKEMCVSSGARRSRIGLGLMQSIERRLASEGFERIYLQTGQTAPARAFYESAGFGDLGLVALGKRIEA